MVGMIHREPFPFEVSSAEVRQAQLAAIRSGTHAWLQQELAAIDASSQEATLEAVRSGMRPSLESKAALPGVWENELAGMLARSRESMFATGLQEVPLRTYAATGKLAVAACRIDIAIQRLTYPSVPFDEICAAETTYLLNVARSLPIPTFSRVSLARIGLWETRLGRAITWLDTVIERPIKGRLPLEVADQARLLCDEGVRLFSGAIAAFAPADQYPPVLPTPLTSIEGTVPWTAYPVVPPPKNQA